MLLAMLLTVNVEVFETCIRSHLVKVCGMSIVQCVFENSSCWNPHGPRAAGFAPTMVARNDSGRGFVTKAIE